MPKKQAIWIHGTSAQMEREGYFISKKRVGYGAAFLTHGEEWFHFSIPTPVILDGYKSSLEKVFVLYKTSNTSKITDVKIFDGFTKIHSFTNLQNYNGDHSQVLDDKNTWELPQLKKVKYGIGISVKVDFGPKTQNAVPSILFVSAGADFIT